MHVELMPDARDPRLAALFEQVFRTPIAPEMLQWKYAEGRGQCVGVLEEGRLLAHCGLTFRRALVEGRPVRVAQLGDLMATGSKPGGLSREQSAFFMLLRKVFDNLPGPGNPEGVAYGFPSARAMRLAQRLELVLDVDRMYELHYAPLRSRGAVRVVEVDPFAAGFGPLVARCWKRMAAGLGHGLVGVRDAEHLRWRYARHPVHRYRFFALRRRWAFRPLAMAICRAESPQWELMDLVAHPDDMALALQALQAHMSAMGAEDLMLWLTRSHARRLGEGALSAEPLQFHIIANPASCAGNPERFRDQWWLTAGDTDYR